MSRRYRCISCRSRIDPDLWNCPACGEHDPLRYLERRRTLAVVFAGVTFVSVCLAAWFSML